VGACCCFWIRKQNNCAKIVNSWLNSNRKLPAGYNLQIAACGSIRLRLSVYLSFLGSEYSTWTIHHYTKRVPCDNNKKTTGENLASIVMIIKVATFVRSKNVDLGWGQRRRTSCICSMFIHCILVNDSAPPLAFSSERVTKELLKLEKGSLNYV